MNKPNKYKKKPVVIETMQWTGCGGEEGALNTHSILQWLSDNDIDYTINTSYEESITISTLEGDMKAIPGDYIIKGIKGEFYPCKSPIFEETYEQVRN